MAGEIAACSLLLVVVVLSSAAAGAMDDELDAIVGNRGNIYINMQD